MSLEKITQVAGTAVCLPSNDIDTDRIIPARFLKCVTFAGLGEFAFLDERQAADGSLKNYPLNDPRFANASILITGSNFGCGSSREHAPQALYRYGFRAILAESFAEIFFGNSLTLGLPCGVLEPEDLQTLAKLIEACPTTEVIVDLVEKKVTTADVDFPLILADHAQEALSQGRWDPIADLLTGLPEVHQKAHTLPYLQASRNV